MRHIAIIGNRLAEKGEKIEEIVSFFSSQKDSLEAEIFDLKNLDTFEEAAQKIKFDTVIACGGDGTVSRVASHLIDKEINLGIIPVGTYNHLAKDLGIPDEINKALEIILKNGQPIKIDTVLCNDRPFLNTSSIGAYPHIVKIREKHLRLGASSFYAYFQAFKQLLNSFPAITLSLHIENRTIVRKTAFVFVGNNEYQLNGLEIGSRKNLSDGVLSVIVSRFSSTKDFFKLFFKILFKGFNEDPIETYRVETLTVKTLLRKKLLVSFDGEIEKMRTPLIYKIKPKSLSVYVPKI